MNKYLVLFLIISLAASGQRTIEGKILDKETGEPVPFASIGIEGTQRGTSSNIDGEFSLVVPDSSSIRISCIGYQTVTLRLSTGFHLIELIPVLTQLDEIVILSREVNPQKIVRKAFANITRNYSTQSFSQKFFYRQYSKVDSAYERLIEASVDVWRPHGYGKVRRVAGEDEAMHINQLRRSLDISGMVQGISPIALGYVLEADLAAYQTAEPSEHLEIISDVNDLKADFDKYEFTVKATTTYDGLEVFIVHYESKQDSILTTSGYIHTPTVNGTLYITTNTFAFVKTEEEREDKANVFKTTAYYRKHNDKYYPYHFVRESENHYRGTHYSHTDLMAVEILPGDYKQAVNDSFDRANLLEIPYDSAYWNTTTILKTTPLEDHIISDLGGGKSLNAQFLLYKQYELNVTDGGNRGEGKFNWLKNESKGKRILYLGFWDSNLDSFSKLLELEKFKRLNQLYKNKITFILLSLENDEVVWKQLVTKHNLFAEGIINYRIGDHSEVAKSFKIKSAPAFILISNDGEVFDHSAKHPTDPLLEKDFNFLIGTN